MTQQLKTDPRDVELTTADIAHSNQPVSSSVREIDRSADGTSSMRAYRNSTDRNQLFADNENSQLNENFERGDGSLAGSADATGIGSATVKDAVNDRNYETPLFSAQEADDFHARWDSVQVSFVDEPRRAVQQADGLVASAMKRLAEIFAEERSKLDKQWDRGDSVSTEDLRLALQRYRSFFGRLLSV